MKTSSAVKEKQVRNIDKIGELVTVNCGEIRSFNLKDPFNTQKKIQLEILRPEKHNRDYEIINYYYWDKEIGAKVEISLYRNIRTGAEGASVYYFKTARELQHYRSRNYDKFIGMPEKHYRIVQYIHSCFLTTYGTRLVLKNRD